MDSQWLKKLTETEQSHLRAKYASALNFLLRFVNKDELSKELFEASRSLPTGTLSHDAMNKAAFAHPEMLESFLRFYVDEPFIKDLDLEHIEHFGGRHCDV